MSGNGKKSAFIDVASQIESHCEKRSLCFFFVMKRLNMFCHTKNVIEFVMRNTDHIEELKKKNN